MAMIIRLMEEKYPLDEVIFYDTGMEFQAIYNNKDKLSKILFDHNIQFTILKDRKPFEFKAFEKEIHKKMDQLNMDMIGVVDLDVGKRNVKPTLSSDISKKIIPVSQLLNILAWHMMNIHDCENPE